MGYTGTVKGNMIMLDEPLPFAEGTRVEVTVTPKVKPRRGSLQALLQLAGTLTEEAEDILKAVQGCCTRKTVSIRVTK
jgi:hypothetical protein